MQKNKFEKRLANVLQKTWSLIAKIDELKGRWIGGTGLSPQILGRLKRSVLMTSTGASTRIEGAHLSDEDVERLMGGMSLKSFADRDKQEVKGYYELLQNVFDSWKSLRFSENTLKSLHNELLKYVAKDARHKGEYKKMENNVVMTDAEGNVISIVFETTCAYLAAKEMQELTEWTVQAFKEKKYHALLIISNFIIEFLKIHPFQDGNGRLSRVLTNLLLLKEGYAYTPYVSHEKLIEDNKSEYYVALRRSQKNFNGKGDDISAWFDFFLAILLKQAENAHDLLSDRNIEKILSPKQLIVWQYIERFDEITPGDIAEKTHIARPTVNQALEKLLRLKRIERIGLGRSTRYRKV
ncbi:Fic family protein [Candidatus Uhrbacteria bacterium]|nr:Fic family protein [Candidatus Uhrbacteria bacterium]